MRKYLLLIALALTCATSYGFSLEATRFHCADDTVKINRLLVEAKVAGLSTPNQYMLYFGEQLLGTPYVAHTLEGDKEYLTINIDQLDCTTFVETLVALTRTALQQSPTWYTYAANLERIRYQGGKVDGYASRLHYISAWIVENAAAGIVREVTSIIPNADSQIKSLYYMSANRDKYPALADSATFAAIKKLESGYNMHMSPLLRKNDLMKKEVIASLQDGDIVCLTTKTEGLDVMHLGIVKFDGKKPHLLHASSSSKKVVVDKYDLYEMLRPMRNCTGVRILRVTDN